ncbi:TonB-dependent receptor [Salinisphaera sp. SPP-AMP-43]|uniref:TonB-dependent receptor n=1 Tax=Salinisphaera sp. SPP-AMP-43 TaxID=3121288 RepID=UPI003C6E3718
MTYPSTSDRKFEPRSAYVPFDWSRASKASICAFMLAFAPLTGAIAQTGNNADDDYVAPAAPAADDSENLGQAAPTGAAPAAPAPAAASDEAPAAAAPAAAAAAPAAATGGSAQSTQLQDVTVTGTAISRPDAATALPVTNYDSEELREQGITSTSQFLQQMVGNNTSAGPGQSTGSAVTGGSSFANLRGLGANKTLILLNGRRLTVNALDGGAVDLNTIPFAAIDHVEVLRDGASALYGTDAIGGVINFITKKNLDGGNVDLNYSMPTRDGGGNSQTMSVTFGKGDFDKDGWNVMGTLSYQRQDAIDANTRDFVTPLDPRIDFTSANTFPGQYIQGSTGVGLINPLAAQNCEGVDALVQGSGNDCRENFTALGAQVQQKYDKPSFFGRANYKINDNNSVSLSYMWSRKTTYSVSAPSPTSGNITIQPGTPYFPGQGNIPVPSNDFDTGSPVSLYYRANPLGPRTNKDTNEYHRVVLDFTGRFLDGFRYDTAFSYNQGTTELNQVNGNFNQYVGNDSLEAAINAGNFNPYTANPTAAERSILAHTETIGRLETDKTRAYIWDGKINHDLGNWFGVGQSALALGAQYRHETLTSDIGGYIADRSPSSGVAASHVDEDRDVESVFGELNIPILDNLELDAQARYDNYSDVGDTVNPKVSLRYQPLRQLTLRASYSEGFHAPTLYDLYQPQVETFTGASLNDPELCPGGSPANGGVSSRDCNNQFRQVIGGNQNLQPEKSKSWSAGFVLQPMKNVSLTADFFAVELSQQIGTLDPTYIFNNYDQYQTRFNRDGNNAIDTFQNTNFNNGKTELNGEDVQLNASLPTDYGTFTLQMQGTYMNKYDTQVAEGGQYYNNVSNYTLGGNIFRWQHNVTLGWNKGPMALGVVNHYSSGYRDYASVPDHVSVHDYVTWDTYGSYSFDNGLQLTVGSNNVFDADPPFSVQTDAGQAGYDARYADGVGRTVYGRLSYNF